MVNHHVIPWSKTSRCPARWKRMRGICLEINLRLQLPFPAWWSLCFQCTTNTGRLRVLCTARIFLGLCSCWFFCSSHPGFLNMHPSFKAQHKWQLLSEIFNFPAGTLRLLLFSSPALWNFPQGHVHSAFYYNYLWAWLYSYKLTQGREVSYSFTSIPTFLTHCTCSMSIYWIVTLLFQGFMRPENTLYHNAKIKLY